MFVNLVRSDDKEIAFRRSTPVRNAILLILAALDCLAYFFFAEQIRVTAIGENEYVWCVPILIVIIINYYMLRFAGPDDLVLDIDRQGYSHTKGYPFFPRTVTGTFGDFYGMCVRSVKNRRGVDVLFRVELDWNAPDRKPLILAEARSLSQALDDQHELALRLATIPIAKD